MDKAIELINVSKLYPGVSALTDVTFSVKKGSVHGFLGPNGAGKSTTMNIITGLIPPTGGTVKVFGEDVQANPESARRKIGFLPEHAPLYENMKVSEYLKFVQSINSLRSTVNSDDYLETLELCGLTEVSHRLIKNLSKGFRQRVAIAQALIGRPEIVILDEPTVGLDPKAIVEIRELIYSLREKHTILLSTHILHEVNLICDHITIINKGIITSTGPIHEIQGGEEGTQIILAEVLNWKDELRPVLFRDLPLEDLLVEKSGSDTRLTFKLKGKDDYRGWISDILVKNQCSLLQLSKQTVDVENLFKSATAEKPTKGRVQ
ncbi:MAG: ABC transporter ATP-binding protein [Bacteriovoracaceae bacterium]|nr:ABC transporter ATP-binding protein [Bacteriovoracaceae bacterium]